MKDAQPQAIQLADYSPPSHLVDETSLRFDLQDTATVVTSVLSIRRNPDAESADPDTLRLDGQDLELLGVDLDGEPLSSNAYGLDDSSLTLHGLPASCEVTVRTRINPAGNTQLEGLYKSGGMYCTQCEAEGFRRITYYPDRPDVMSRFTTTIVADDGDYPVLLSNGNEVGRQRLEDGRLAVTWEDPFRKPAYLFALVAGDLAMIEDSFTTMGGRDVALQVFSEAHNIGQCSHAMDSLKRAMHWDEQVYGREYDLDVFMIVAVDTFNMGAMENKGLNIFNTSCVLATADTTTDAGFQRVEAVVAHEYFHNWSGNRVTCRDWFQLSLKEGFTVFRDAAFSSDMNSATVKRVEDVNFLRTFQFPEDGGPMAHPIRPDSYIEISNFYTTTIYEKGAEVVRMYHTLLGAERFRQGSDLYFKRHDGQAVTCEDFTKAMEDATGVDLGQFRRWYSQAGTPVLTVQDSWDPATGSYSLHLHQYTPDSPGQTSKQALHIPVCVGLLAADGRELLGAAGAANGFDVQLQGDLLAENPNGDGTLTLHLREADSHCLFTGLSARPVLSLLRGFSAPVKVRWQRPDADLAFLMLNDPDGFGRWDAAQTWLVAVLQGMQAELASGRTPAVPQALVDAFRTLLDQALVAADDGEQKAMLALMLNLPSEPYLAEAAEVIEPLQIHQVRELARQGLAQALAKPWQAVYDANAPEAEYSPAAANVARRQLRNLALSYLSLLDDQGTLPRLDSQYQQANNMTDRMAALKELVGSGHAGAEPLRQQLLGAFYQQWQQEALVIDQWFAVQAADSRPGGLARVNTLLQHPAMDRKVPNRIRALVGNFSGANQANFHAADGSGYGFVADRVLELDQLNPQVASRLLTPLTRWQRFAPAHQRLMRQQLERIAAAANLSRDVFEVVSKSLAD